MTEITDAKGAAKAWVDGDREVVRDWCRLSSTPVVALIVNNAMSRTAAVALELSGYKPKGLGYDPESNHREDFLRFMSGANDE